MENEQVVSTDMRMFDFMYRKISMPNVCMAAWLRVPVFVEEMSSLIAGKEEVNDEVVLKVTEVIISDLMLHRKENKDLRLQTLRRGINHLRKAIYPMEE